MCTHIQNMFLDWFLLKRTRGVFLLPRIFLNIFPLCSKHFRFFLQKCEQHYCFLATTYQKYVGGSRRNLEEYWGGILWKKWREKYVCKYVASGATTPQTYPERQPPRTTWCWGVGAAWPTLESDRWFSSRPVCPRPSQHSWSPPITFLQPTNVEVKGPPGMCLTVISKKRYTHQNSTHSLSGKWESVRYTRKLHNNWPSEIQTYVGVHVITLESKILFDYVRCRSTQKKYSDYLCSFFVVIVILSPCIVLPDCTTILMRHSC